MESFSTLLIIFVVLIASVGGITVIQRREQAKAKLRQQVAKYRYRANETANILENFSKIPIGEEARRRGWQLPTASRLQADWEQHTGPLCGDHREAPRETSRQAKVPEPARLATRRHAGTRAKCLPSQGGYLASTERQAAALRSPQLGVRGGADSALGL